MSAISPQRRMRLTPVHPLRNLVNACVMGGGHGVSAARNSGVEVATKSNGMTLTGEIDSETLVLVLRQGILFAHLIGFSIVFSAIIREDWALATAARLDPEALRRTAGIAFALLAFLWATGLCLVALDVGLDPVAILAKPKLMTKIGVVSVLTLNGFLLHWLAFPLLTQPQRRPNLAAAVCAALGAISLVSWSYAAFVGVARLIAPKLTLTSFAQLYALSLAFGVVAALVFIRPRIARLISKASTPLRVAPLEAAA